MCHALTKAQFNYRNSQGANSSTSANRECLTAQMEKPPQEPVGRCGALADPRDAAWSSVTVLTLARASPPSASRTAALAEPTGRRQLELSSPHSSATAHGFRIPAWVRAGGSVTPAAWAMGVAVAGRGGDGRGWGGGLAAVYARDGGTGPRELWDIQATRCLHLVFQHSHRRTLRWGP